jgi:hypothetical protein
MLPRAAVVPSKGELTNIEVWETAIVPQMTVRGYRLDFGVLHRPANIAFGLECDGREFHRHTRKDCNRTVNLRDAGVIVFRASGSALVRHARFALLPLARMIQAAELWTWLNSENSTLTKLDVAVASPAAAASRLAQARQIPPLAALST